VWRVGGVDNKIWLTTTGALKKISISYFIHGVSVGILDTGGGKCKAEGCGGMYKVWSFDGVIAGSAGVLR
jgi:hypothetical protein